MSGTGYGGVLVQAEGPRGDLESPVAASRVVNGDPGLSSNPQRQLAGYTTLRLINTRASGMWASLRLLVGRANPSAAICNYSRD